MAERNPNRNKYNKCENNQYKNENQKPFTGAWKTIDEQVIGAIR